MSSPASQFPPSSKPARPDSDSEEDDGRRGFGPQTAMETQAARVARLMTRVDKPISLPERKDKSSKAPRDFVRNVQGSSAGAGSGEFHVYRALRRKEYARQKLLDENAKEAEEQDQFHERLAAMKKEAEEKTAKNREKRKKRNNRSNEKSKKTKTDAAASDASTSAPAPVPSGGSPVKKADKADGGSVSKGATPTVGEEGTT
ncbi:hypothetical protein HKX48_005464 [Thoreauomyces humboldtii]|nr:hypothetical protein HKX48_005464 [Thoreauomyces humboldtii]